MSFDYIEENIISKYWKTLKRKNISNIPTNKFIKKPYLEKYIIDLSINLKDDILTNKILELLENNEITCEELILFLKNNIELNDNEKKNIEMYFLKSDYTDLEERDDTKTEIDDDADTYFNKISIEIIIFQIKYFQFYITITELLFNSDDQSNENNELYNFILILVKNDNKELKKLKKNNVYFNIIHTYFNHLYELFENIIKMLIKMKLIETNYDKNDILNILLKNLFMNWYNIYKNDILENKVNDKIKKYSKKRSIIAKLLCLPNI
jgi:hypothetical protein